MVRGEIYLVDLKPRSGSEQAGRRPCIIVSTDAFNQARGWRSITGVPLTSSDRWQSPWPTTVLFNEGESGFQSAALLWLTRSQSGSTRNSRRIFEQNRQNRQNSFTIATRVERAYNSCRNLAAHVNERWLNPFAGLLLGFLVAFHGFMVTPLGLAKNPRASSCCRTGCSSGRCSTPVCCAKSANESAPVTPTSALSNVQNELQALVPSSTLLAPLPSCARDVLSSVHFFFPIPSVPLFQRNCSYLI
jgi:mRNA-degrading endonuclease toxin of MazEF toxin-antitoxin module